MKYGKLWFLVALAVLAMLPLAGCGGSSSPVTQTQNGYKVTVDGKVTTPPGKTAALSSYSTVQASSIYVIDAQSGKVLTSGSVAADGSFTGITFTMPAAKGIVVFKAVVASGTFHSIVPIDLSNPPTTLGSSNALAINLDQNTENIAKTVSQLLGLTGILGDGGQALASIGKTYTDAATLVAANGGQTLAYVGNSLTLNGKVNASLLPAVQASTLSVDDLNNMILDGKVVSAFIPGNNPIVNFQVTNKATGKGIAGLRQFALHVAQLKPEVNGDNSYWLSYILDVKGAARDREGLPTSDPAGYTVVDNGDGSYVVTFKTNVKAPNPAVRSGLNAVYDASLVHRIGIAVTTVATSTYAGPIDPATGKATPGIGLPGVANLIYDFTPATGAMLADPAGKQAFARDIVIMGACNECHYKFTMPGHHFGSRSDTKLCVMCHNAQNVRTTGTTINGVVTPQPSAEFSVLIHKIHMGEELPTKNSIIQTDGITATITFGEVRYPQDIRNCTKCHKGADVDNWNSKPTIKACGSCHNAIDFATAKGTTNDGRTVGHIGGVKTDNKTCVLCHDGAAVKGYHVAVAGPDPNSTYNGGTNPYTNASNVAAAGAVPTGAKVITYSVKSVSRNASKQPVITFKFLKDGADVVFNTGGTALAPKELMDGFVGSPSVSFAYALPQDGINTPADFNASASGYIKSINNGVTTDTITGPDTTGFYTITLTGYVIPDTATLLTGGVGYSYALTSTPPLTQIDLAAYPYNATSKIGGLSVPPPNVWKTATGYTARRTIVSNEKCNACHAQLGVKPTFHAGQHNDAPTCAFCHTPNRTSSGWSAASTTFVHGIHAAAKRTVGFNWHAVSPTKTYASVGYPGILRNCEQCHVAGGYDFSGTTNWDTLLFRTVATGKFNGADTTKNFAFSPYVTTDNITDYGTGYSVAADGTVTAAAGTTLVSSPIASACFSCHDTSLAKAHMVLNGGSIYEARTTALSKKETCIVCHGPSVDPATGGSRFNATVPTIKAVHRWW